MSPRLVLLAVALVAGAGVVWCHDATIAGNYGPLTDIYDEQDSSEHIRDRRQADFSTEKDELRRACLIKSRQACCSLLKKDAEKFATCVKGYSWSNGDQKGKPGCPGYPRCHGFKRG